MIYGHAGFSLSMLVSLKGKANYKPSWCGRNHHEVGILQIWCSPKSGDHKTWRIPFSKPKCWRFQWFSRPPSQHWGNPQVWISPQLNPSIHPSHRITTSPHYLVDSGERLRFSAGMGCVVSPRVQCFGPM